MLLDACHYYTDDDFFYMVRDEFCRRLSKSYFVSVDPNRNTVTYSRHQRTYISKGKTLTVVNWFDGYDYPVTVNTAVTDTEGVYCYSKERHQFALAYDARYSVPDIGLVPWKE